MTKKQLEIIHSILNQIGGLYGPEDLNITNSKDFYSKWDKFTSRAIHNLKLLTENEKSFVLGSAITINRKLVSGEAQTLTGYEDDERADAINALREELKINTGLDNTLENLPAELQT